ncbi:MAG: 2'-5' RNA ligase family protein [Sphingobium sp.]
MHHESLSSRPAASPVLHRFFFALVPPAREARRTVAQAERLGPEWRLQAASRLHVTLAITADHTDYPHALLERLVCVGDRVAAAPFTLTLDRLVLAHRSAALRPSRTDKALTTLNQAITAQMRAAAIPMREAWRFAPHMTLGYRASGALETRTVPALGWHADAFVLIHSAAGLTRHRCLQRWPLIAPRDDQYSLF